MEEKKLNQTPDRLEQAELPEEQLKEISGGTRAPYGPADSRYRPAQTETEEEPTATQRRPGY